MAFGCCNSFEECSDLGSCIHEGEPMYEGCMYKENLDKGLNFYTKYNENNQKRASEYLKNKQALEQKAKIEVKQTDKKTNKGTYIEIPNRIFRIGRRGSYRGWTYDLDDEESSVVINKLKSYDIHCTKEIDLSKCKSESSNDTPCSRVILDLDGDKYNISNHDMKAVKKDTAVKIASYLSKRGLKCEIEVIYGFGKTKIAKVIVSHTTIPVKKQAVDKQLSMFEMLPVMDSSINL